MINLQLNKFGIWMLIIAACSLKELFMPIVCFSILIDLTILNWMVDLQTEYKNMEIFIFSMFWGDKKVKGNRIYKAAISIKCQDYVKMLF